MWRKPVRAIVALLVVAFAFLVATSPVTAQEAEDPAETPVGQRVSDLVSPSIVYVEIIWQATFEVAFYEEPLWRTYGPYEIPSSCTGFFVSNDGDIATAGHCVLPDDELHAAFLEMVIADLAAEGNADASDDEFFGQALQNWPINYEKQVTVYETIDASGRVEMSGTTASVVDFRDPDNGDLALLSISTDETWPALEIAPDGEPQTGSDVYTYGFPGSVADLVDAESLSSSFEPGSVSSNPTELGVEYIQVTSDISGGMSGGPTVNAKGQVLGINSHTPRNAEQAFITGTDDLRDFLDGHGVSLELSEADAAYRTGLTSYFDGDYEVAVEQFETVLAAQPNHVEAVAYKANALERVPEDSGSILPFVLIGLGVVIVVGILVVLLRQRSPGNAAPPVAPTLASNQPTLPFGAPVVPLHRNEPKGPGDICGDCGHGNPPGSNFCGACGRPLTPTTSAG